MKAYIRIPLILLCTVLLLGLVDSVALSGINAGVMSGLFEECAEIRGHDEVARGDYPDIAGAIVTYLRTGRDEDIPRLRGEVLFSERENLHLKDCSALIRGMMAFRIVFIVLLCAVLALYIVLRARAGAEKTAGLLREGARCLAAGCMIVLGLALIPAAWGLIDFNGLFLAFHRVAFTNDLWLLDSSRDLLVQLMTYEFFVRYAGKILISLLPCLAMMALFPVLIIRLKNETTAP